MKCPKCKRKRPMTRHSEIGGHQPPFKPLCRECHDEVHGIRKRKSPRQNRKIQRGTRYGKHKKK